MTRTVRAARKARAFACRECPRFACGAAIALRTCMDECGLIERFMVADHARIDGLLKSAMAGATVDIAAFQAFRASLLRHIGMEEKILVPLLRDRGAPWPHAEQMRREHGAIAKLLVPTPTIELCDRICDALARHNPIEEADGGLYAACDAAAGADAGRIVERLRAAPRVPLAKHYDGPLLR